MKLRSSLKKKKLINNKYKMNHNKTKVNIFKFFIIFFNKILIKDDFKIVKSKK